MKKTMIMRVMAMVLAVATAFSPVTTEAAEKKVVTREEYNTDVDALFDDEEISGDTLDAALYDYVKSLNGCYNENGVKIYTVLDGKTKKITKTGKYDIVVGGKKAKTDEGTIKFVAPKAGTYKFTFTVKTNVTGGNVCITTREGLNMKTDYYQEIDGKKVKDQGWSTLILLANNGTASRPSRGDYLDAQPKSRSEMQTITGTIKLKKGQSISFVGRNPNAGYNEDTAYKFTDYVVTIKKVK